MYGWAAKDILAHFLPCYYVLDKRLGNPSSSAFSNFPYEAKCYLSESENGKAKLVSSEKSDLLQESLFRDEDKRAVF